MQKLFLTGFLASPIVILTIPLLLWIAGLSSTNFPIEDKSLLLGSQQVRRCSS